MFTYNRSEMASVKAIIRKGKINKDGTVAVKIRIIENRKPREISTGQRIKPEHWDDAKGEVKKSHPNSVRLNKFIADKIAEYRALAIEIDEGNVSLKEKTIREALLDFESNDFFVYLQGYVEGRRAAERWGELSNYSATYKRLGKFCKFLGMDGLRFKDFTRSVAYPKRINKVKFMEALEIFQREELKYADSTINLTCRHVAKIFNLAIDNENLHPKYYPLKGYKVPKCGSRRKYLTPEQIAELIRLPQQESPIVELSRDIYLFSALGGGLRYGDLANLKWGSIRGKSLDVDTRKTGKHVWFDLGEVPLAILDKYRPKGHLDSNAFVFPLLDPNEMKGDSKTAFQHCRSKQKVLSRGLVYLAKQIGIDHLMSIHTARHTFATLAVRKGVKVTVLQKILGHSDLTTTQKYYHMLGEDVKEEVEKFNNRTTMADMVAQKKAEERAAAPGAGMLRFYVKQTANMLKERLAGFKGIVVNGADLEAFQKEASLPELARRKVAVRVFLVGEGDGQMLADSLNANSLFGSGVEFKAFQIGDAANCPAQEPENVLFWEDDPAKVA